MKLRMKILELQEERDGRLVQSMKNQMKIKKTRKLGHIDPRAKKGMLPRRMKSKAKTKRRKVINLEVVAKAKKRAEGQGAEIKVTGTKVMRGEVAPEAEREILT